jgi:hypothetical protein
VPEYDSPRNAYPSGTRWKPFDIGLYRVGSPHPVASNAARLELLIGERDDLNVLRFHAKERLGGSGVPFRWSRDVSYVVLTGLTPRMRAITIWMGDGHRPSSLPEPRVEVALEEHVIGTLVVRRQIAPFRFPLPAWLLADVASREHPPRLRLRVTTWSPAKALGSRDERQLGVMVTRVEVE